MQDKPVTLAAVAGAHGVAGEVRLKLFGEGLEGLRPHKSFNGGALTLSKVRSDNKGGATISSTSPKAASPSWPMVLLKPTVATSAPRSTSSGVASIRACMVAMSMPRELARLALGIPGRSGLWLWKSSAAATA